MFVPFFGGELPFVIAGCDIVEGVGGFFFCVVWSDDVEEVRDASVFYFFCFCVEIPFFLVCCVSMMSP